MQKSILPSVPLFPIPILSGLTIDRSNRLAFQEDKNIRESVEELYYESGSI